MPSHVVAVPLRTLQPWGVAGQGREVLGVLTRASEGLGSPLAVFRAFPLNAAPSLPPPRVVLFSWLEVALCLLELVCGLASEVLVVRLPEGQLRRSLLVSTNFFG